VLVQNKLDYIIWVDYNLKQTGPKGLQNSWQRTTIWWRCSRSPASLTSSEVSQRLSHCQATDLTLHKLLFHNSLKKEQKSKEQGIDGWIVEHSDHINRQSIKCAIAETRSLQCTSNPAGKWQYHGKKKLITVQGSQETNDELMIATSVLVAMQSYWILVVKLTTKPWCTKWELKKDQDRTAILPPKHTHSWFMIRWRSRGHWNW
jgi:hypothetical protein